MIAAYLTRLGGPEQITIGSLPVPQPGPTEVLVAVEAVAANLVDTLIRAGAYPTPTPFPFVVGRDLVGTVVEVGAAIPDYRPGDRVWCNSLGHDGRQGSFAAYAVVPGERLYPLPPGNDPVTTVALAHNAATAYLGLFVHSGLRAGQRVYVGGAAGNVGMAALQLAHAAGAEVIAGARPADHERCRAAGADATLDYADPDLAERLDGVDLFWNTSRHLDLDAATAAVRVGGTILVTAGWGARPELPVSALYTRDAALRGFVISRARASDLAAAARAINRFVGSGVLTAHAVEELPLAETAQAHRRIEAGDLRGRLVLRP